jgi:predicted  nucleic acid-binding Zn-ribbon protein
MLSTSTPLERLTQLVAQLIEKQATQANELLALTEELTKLQATLTTQKEEIAKLENELLEKDIEIENMVSNLEAVLR